MIKISEKAAIRLNELKISENHNSDFNLRVLVKGGGCSGLMYDLKFDNEISDTDKIFEEPESYNLKISAWNQYSPTEVADLIKNV